MTTQVGIRELKTHLSRYLDEVKAGGVIVITDKHADVPTSQDARKPASSARASYHSQLSPNPNPSFMLLSAWRSNIKVASG